MEYGKGVTVIIEVSTPFHWGLKLTKDSDTKMYRITWLLFAIAFLPIGYVEHRCILLEAAWRKGLAYGEDKEKENVRGKTTARL